MTSFGLLGAEHTDTLGHLEQVNQRHAGKIGLVFDFGISNFARLVRAGVSSVSDCVRPILNCSRDEIVIGKEVDLTKKRFLLISGVLLGISERDGFKGGFKRQPIGHSSAIPFFAKPRVFSLKKYRLRLCRHKLWASWRWWLWPDFNEIKAVRQLGSVVVGCKNYVLCNLGGGHDSYRAMAVISTAKGGYVEKIDSISAVVNFSMARNIKRHLFFPAMWASKVYQSHV